MKRILLLILFSALMTNISYSQSALNTGEFTWFGIDYTQCYYLTPIDFPSISDLEAKIKAWNDLVLDEQEKYIAKALAGKNVDFAIEAVTKRNETINVKSMLTEDETKAFHLETNQIQQIIENYNIEESLNGTGLVLIAESYHRLDERGNYYIAFFDIATKKVFVTEHMSGKAKGIGLRNYWAATYYNVLKSIGKKY